MDSPLSINNILFYLDQNKDISSLFNQEESTQCGNKRSSLECKRLITAAFSPQVPVTCSQAADVIANEFGFDSFFQLLKPFGDGIHHKFQIKDSQLISRTTDDFSLRFTRPLHDLLTVQAADSGSKTQLVLHHSLEVLMTDYTQLINSKLQAAFNRDDKAVESLLKESVYIEYFTKLLASSKITPFEFMNHPISTFFIISTNDTYDQARQLLINFKQAKLPEYLDIEDILPIYVVLQNGDDEAEEAKAVQLKEHLKKQLFVDSFVLSLTFNKESHPTTPNPPVLMSVDEELQSSRFVSTASARLPASNITAIYKLLKEIIQKKIIRFMEQKIATWDEQVVAPRKSLSGRFFSASKRYFGTNKNQSNEHQTNYNPELGYYRNQTSEAITRKLADWSFILRDYKYAYTTYELAKKEFLSDKAWSHLASTQEMAAISLLMGATNITSKLKNDTIDPLLDSANYTYLARCGYKTYALRSILIVSELFCTLRDGWSNAPTALKWVKKALDDKLVGRIGRYLLLQRVSYIYSLHISSQTKIIISKKLNENEAETGAKNGHDLNDIKLETKSMATIGLTRHRKAALWSLLAAKECDLVVQPLQVQLSLKDSKHMYESLTIANREDSLYKKLDDASLKRINA